MIALYTILKPKRNVYYDVKIHNSLDKINFNDKNDKTNYIIVIGNINHCK
jgi:hypothetical protein